MSDAPINAERYERMLRFMRTAETMADLEKVALMYILDLSYARPDIARAMRVVEKEKGFR